MDLEAEREEVVTEETWAKRKAARQRQIDIGKARGEYVTYTNKVPFKTRTDNHPQTPDPKERISKRAFDKRLSIWRRSLHEYDSDAEQPDLHVRTTFSPFTDSTESTRAESEEASSPLPPMPTSGRQTVKALLPLPLAELLPPSASVASQQSPGAVPRHPGLSAEQQQAAANRCQLSHAQLLQQQPGQGLPTSVNLAAGLMQPTQKPLPVGLHLPPPPYTAQNVRQMPMPQSAPRTSAAAGAMMAAQMQAQMAAYSGLLWQYPGGPAGPCAAPWLPTGLAQQPATTPCGPGTLPAGAAPQTPQQKPVTQPVHPFWGTVDLPGPLLTSNSVVSGQNSAFLPATAPLRERLFSFSSSSSAEAEGNPITGKAAVKAPRKQIHLELPLAGATDVDGEPLSPTATRKPSDNSEPKTPPMMSKSHVFESPSGRVTCRSPASFGNTPSPQQSGYLRTSACRLNAISQPQAAQQQAAVRTQANAFAAPFRMVAPMGLQGQLPAPTGTPGQAASPMGIPGQPATPTGVPGQLATPVQRGPGFPFVQTPGQGPSAAAGMQASWVPASGSTPGMPAMFSPAVFQFGRPAPHILTPSPPLPFGSSPPLRQGNGLTPGPKHSPPDACGGCSGQDRDTAAAQDAALHEFTAHCMEKWRRSSN